MSVNRLSERVSNNLQHRCETSSTGYHANVLSSVRSILYFELYTTKQQTIANVHAEEMFRHQSTLLPLHDKIKVTFCAICSNRGVEALTLIHWLYTVLVTRL